MKRRISLVVLNIDIAAPGIEIINCCIRHRVARPVQWSTALLVNRINVDSDLLEEAQAVCLVSLCSHMHHVEATLGFNERICTIFNKQRYNLWIAVAAREMQRIELLATRLGRIDPIAHVVISLMSQLTSHIVWYLIIALQVEFETLCVQ